MKIGAAILRIPILRWDRPEMVGEFLLPQPEGWRHIVELEPDMTAFSEPGGLRVLVSILVEQDEQQWLHISFSRRDRVPHYQEMCRVKRDFAGPARKALQIFPAAPEHVSDHPYCLHLWCCLTADRLPDFRRGLGTI